MIALGVLGLVAGGCSDDDGDDGSVVTTAGTSATPAVGSDLVMEGEQDCDDEEGDVTTAAAADVPPSVEQPGIDLLGVHAELDDETLTVEYSLVSPPDPLGEPQFLMSIGAADSLAGFELEVKQDEAGWFAQLSRREQGSNPPIPLPDAEVQVDGAVVTMAVPVVALPTIGPEMPLLFGSSGLARDGDHFIDNRGQPSDDPTKADRVLDDCIQFGQ